jgi:hypothetical protein
MSWSSSELGARASSHWPLNSDLINLHRPIRPPAKSISLETPVPLLTSSLNSEWSALHPHNSRQDKMSQLQKMFSRNDRSKDSNSQVSGHQADMLDPARAMSGKDWSRAGGFALYSRDRDCHLPIRPIGRQSKKTSVLTQMPLPPIPVRSMAAGRVLTVQAFVSPLAAAPILQEPVAKSTDECNPVPPHPVQKQDDSRIRFFTPFDAHKFANWETALADQHDDNGIPNRARMRKGSLFAELGKGDDFSGTSERFQADSDTCIRVEHAHSAAPPVLAAAADRQEPQPSEVAHSDEHVIGIPRGEAHQNVQQMLHCTKCNIICPTQESLAEHIRIIHSTQSQAPAQTESSTHPRPAICIECFVVFKTSEKLRRHRRAVHGELNTHVSRKFLARPEKIERRMDRLRKLNELQGPLRLEWSEVPSTQSCDDRSENDGVA